MYAKINNGLIEKYPYTIGELRKDNPNTSFPSQISDETLAEFGVVTVEPVDPPKVNYTQTRRELTPVFETGVWKQKWLVESLSQEQIEAQIESKAAQVRAERNERLSATDWTQAKDISDEVSQAWVPYRQALRDISKQGGFPFDVVWPEQGGV
jgi:DNA-binding HxlR family transcriptional regulator